MGIVRNYGPGYKPGTISNSVRVPYQKEDPAKADRDNRTKVLETLIKYVESGMNLDQAIEILVENDEVKSNFAYLTKAGVDLNTLFRNLYTSHQHRKNTKRDSWGRTLGER